MAEKGIIHSIDELLKHPEVKDAKSLGVSIYDAVHFRLMKPEFIFQMAELHLEKRYPGEFHGFADCRSEVELNLRGSSIPDKIAACCTRHPEWLDGRQILYSTELEVWMDMSYPNPLTLQLYHAVLMAGKSFVIPKLGPFSATFHTLLKEKNGYELTSDPLPDGATVDVLVGDHSYSREEQLNLTFQQREYRVHPFASEENLGGQLANGILEKALEDHSAKATPDELYLPDYVGYRLLGPSLLLLIQELFGRLGPVGFIGPGADFLEELTRSLNYVWPDLPEIAPSGQAPVNYSLFPDETPGTSLFPDAATPDAPSILSLEDLNPHNLILPGVRLFLKALLEGSQCAGIRSGAEAFVREFASLTRGLMVRLPAEPVAQHWRETLLAPEEEMLGWATLGEPLPGFTEMSYPWQLVNQLREGPWPSASYLLAKPVSRWWLKFKIPEKVKAVQAAMESC